MVTIASLLLILLLHLIAGFNSTYKAFSSSKLTKILYDTKYLLLLV